MTRDVQAAGAAVEAAAGQKGWGIIELAARAGVDPGTVGDFAAGKRWPQTKTRGALELVLGWPAGSIARIADGAAPPDVRPSAQDAEPDRLPVGSGVDPQLLAELAQADPAAIEAVRAVLKAARRED